MNETSDGTSNVPATFDSGVSFNQKKKYYVYLLYSYKDKGFTDEDELYIRKVVKLLEEGGLPKQTTKTLIKQASIHFKGGLNPLRLLAVLKTTIAPEFFRETIAESSAQTSGPREVILSEYLVVPQ